MSNNKFMSDFETEEYPRALICPECLTEVDQDELDTFGGLCEECSGAFDNK